MSTSDIDGDGKVTLEQCHLTLCTVNQLRADKLETDMNRSLEAAGISEEDLKEGRVNPKVQKKLESDWIRSLEAIGINSNTLQGALPK